MALLAGAALAAVAVARTRTASDDTMAFSAGLEAISEARAGVFAQCAGNGINQKCAPGCLCTYKSPFFSSCKPIDGGSQCNLELAKAFLKKAKKKAAPLEAAVKKTSAEKEKTGSIYKKAAAEAATKSKAAADAAALKAKTAEEATMKWVKAKHESNVTHAQDHLREAKDHQAKVKKESAEHAAKKIKEAEEHVKAMELNLANVKVEAKKQVEEKVAAQKRKVQEAIKHEKAVNAAPLDPVLKIKKARAEAAAKRADAAAKKAKAAGKAAAEAKEDKEWAADEAATALEKVASAAEKVKQWRKAVV